MSNPKHDRIKWKLYYPYESIMNIYRNCHSIRANEWRICSEQRNKYGYNIRSRNINRNGASDGKYKLPLSDHSHRNSGGGFDFIYRSRNHFCEFYNFIRIKLSMILVQLASRTLSCGRNQADKYRPYKLTFFVYAYNRRTTIRAQSERKRQDSRGRGHRGNVYPEDI